MKGSMSRLCATTFFKNHLLKADCETTDSEDWFSNPLGDGRNSFVAKPMSYFDYLTSKGASGEIGLEALWHGNLWKKGEDAMKDASNT